MNRPADLPTAVVLAGGLGTRLRDCVADRPKALAEVAGRPYLGHLLDQLVDAGFTRAVLCIGYLGDQIEARYGTRYRTLSLRYSREVEPAGTGGAVRAALPSVQTDELLICNGDSYADVDLAKFVTWARQRGTDAGLVSVRLPDTGRYGRLELGPDDEVLDFAEKSASSGPGAIHAGILWLRRALVESWPDRTPLSLEHDILPNLGLGAWVQDARFIDIGTPDSFADAQQFFARPPRAGLLVLDRDGTVIEEKHYLSDPDQVALLPGAAAGLRAFQARGFELAIVTNQSGIGRGYFDADRLDAIHDRMLELLTAAGVEIAGIWHCPHHPDAGCACRKPGTELLETARTTLGFAADQCVVVGDKECDIELGARGGARTALVRTGYGRRTEAARECAPDVVVDSLEVLAASLSQPNLTQ